MMRNPITDLAGHLAWTNYGVVWATWRISPVAYGRRPMKDKRSVRDLHRLLVRSLDGEALMLGVAVSLDPVAVVQRQIEGVLLHECPDLAREAEANLDRLAQLVLGERAYYLSVPLANAGRSRVAAPMRAAAGTVADLLALPRAHPSAAEIAARMAQAAKIGELIPAPFAARPASVAEQLWLAEHACRRGMLDSPPPEVGSVDEQLTLACTRLPEPILDEGAWSDEDAPTLRNPLARRVLKVNDPRAAELGQPASYQCPMVLTDTPQGGLAWPGSELLSALDDMAADVDWAIRLRVNSRDQVMRENRKALRELNDQFDQRSDEASLGTSELDLAADLLAAYQSIFAGDRLEVEVEHTVILTVAGESAESTMDRAKGLATVMASSDFRLERPCGGLSELWWATQIGVPTTRSVRGWSLFTAGGQFAALVPYTSTHLGGRQGHTAALNRSSGRTGVVHLDPAGYPEIDKNGSVVFIGENGSGKSFGLKSLCDSILNTGGQVMAIDKSNEGEWATFASTYTSPTIVDPTEPAWSMDPIRVLGRVEGSPVAASFLTQLLGVSPQEEDGTTLGQVLDPAYLALHGLDSLRAVLIHLQGECLLPNAAVLGQRMSNYAGSALGRLVFDDTLPAVGGDDDIIVWRTHTMSQPTEQEIATPHLFRQLSQAKVFGRAYYTLTLGIARRFAFADIARASVLVCDEGYDLFGNPENAHDIEHFGRQGRRPKALLAIGTHDAENDLGSDALRGLIPTRIIMRQSDDRLARAAVRYLGIDEDDPTFEEVVEAVRFHTAPADPDHGVPPERRGEAWLRDVFGGIGPIQVLGPAVPERYAAVCSTPPKARTAA